VSVFRRTIDDVHKLGFRFLWRHVARFSPDKIAIVQVSDFGPAFLRYGESDAEVVRQVVGHLHYDVGPAVKPRVLSRYQAIVDSGRVPVIIDAGANIGVASLWFARQYPDAIIAAVEPEPGNFSILEKNATLQPRVKPINAAIGSTAGFVQIENESLGWAARTTRASTGVPIITIEDILGGIENAELLIVKIDIEGFESDLFSSSTDWLSKAFLVYIEPHDWLFPGKGTSFTFQRAMVQEEFELHLCGENLAYVRA
jgi:FkbM family methyltransferase